MREVVQRGGVRFPGGEIVPQGAWVSIPAAAIHYDERSYPDPEKYDPFLFTPDRAKDAETVDPGTPKIAESDPKHRGLSTSLSTASPIFLGFGYGRHSWYVF